MVSVIEYSADRNDMPTERDISQLLSDLTSTFEQLQRQGIVLRAGDDKPIQDLEAFLKKATGVGAAIFAGSPVIIMEDAHGKAAYDFSRAAYLARAWDKRTFASCRDCANYRPLSDRQWVVPNCEEGHGSDVRTSMRTGVYESENPRSPFICGTYAPKNTRPLPVASLIKKQS